MEPFTFTEKDIKQIQHHGLTLEEVKRQLALFDKPRSFLKLAAPCTVGDGIRTIDPEKKAALMGIYEQDGIQRQCVKFVPASGAASRMFKFLLRYFHEDGEITLSTLSSKASEGDKDAEQFLVFAKGLRKFAFFQDLQSIMADNSFDMETLMKRDRFRDILRCLLTREGLNYAGLPKGLLKFHEYAGGGRTAFEEHLVEAARYVAGKEGRCVLRFTVSEAHLDKFHDCFQKVKGGYEQAYGVAYDLSFSLQYPSTDTLAVDLDNRPFRQDDGTLLFRPGGHGALLRNLGDIEGDIVFIKNIDNVVPDYLKPVTFEWKKIMGGCLIEVQGRIFAFLEKLNRQSVTPEILSEATDFLENDLLTPIPDPVKVKPLEERRDDLIERLDRPIRVCGMVKNVGEPGGGPFWVEDNTGQRSLQIVETAQIDMDSREQRQIFEASTHFNPVDLVCGVRNWKGDPFDLSRFVDPGAVFISRKSKDGKDLKALEHPGLWNGSMSRWMTLFVEVPGITFNPVKTVNDLLRKEHQPE